MLSVVAYPVQIAVASPFEGWDWFRESVTSRDALRADKARLEAELRLAQFRLQRYEALEAESQRLRALRDNTAGVADRFVIGNIMDLDIDAFRERVLVDKGAQDGVFVGQAVLDAGGVFGQVARVGQLTSEVILVSDATHAIPVQVNRNGLRTIAVGTGDMGRLKLPYLPTSADVVVGDLLVTSGLGRRLSGRLSGGHRRRGQARSGAVSRRCRRETGRRARSVARADVRLVEAAAGRARFHGEARAAARCGSPERARARPRPGGKAAAAQRSKRRMMRETRIRRLPMALSVAGRTGARRHAPAARS